MTLSNWNTPASPNVNPSVPLQSSGNFEQGLQGFSSETVPDDFGDFQQSSSMQFPAMPTAVEPEVPKTDLPIVSGVEATVQQSAVTSHSKDKEPVASVDSRKTGVYFVKFVHIRCVTVSFLLVL